MQRVDVLEGSANDAGIAWNDDSGSLRPKTYAAAQHERLRVSPAFAVLLKPTLVVFSHLNQDV